jgi:hypothetical protein
MAMPGLATAAVPRGAGLSDVLGIGDIVRVTGGDAALPGVSAARGAAEPDQVTMASTAAAPVRNITVKAPTERRAPSRAREPVTCTSPRNHQEKFLRHFRLSVVDLSLPDLRCYWPLGSHVRRLHPAVGVAVGESPLGGGMGRRALRRKWIAVVGSVLLAFVSVGLTPSVAAAKTSIYVVQGLPGRTVSVDVDDDTLIGALAGGKVAGPFPVKHGIRTVTVMDGSQTLVTNKVRLPAGSNSEIVVHLPASPTGDPVITRFDNNLRAVQKGKAAQAVAHVAAAGPIDVRVDKKVIFANVATGEYLYKVVPAMTYSVDFVPTGKSKPLLGQLDLKIKRGKLTWVFLIGEPGKDTAVVRHVIDLTRSNGSKRPKDVRTGTGGQAAELRRIALNQLITG